MAPENRTETDEPAAVQFEQRIPAAKSIVEDAGDLVAWTHTVVGDALRSVAAYGEGTLEYRYVRDDVENAYDREELAAIAEEFSSAESIGDDRRARRYRLGTPEYTVHGFSEGTLVRVPIDADRGLVVTLDADADVQFPKFVGELREANPEVALE